MTHQGWNETWKAKNDMSLRRNAEKAKLAEKKTKKKTSMLMEQATILNEKFVKLREEIGNRTRAIQDNRENFNRNLKDLHKKQTRAS